MAMICHYGEMEISMLQLHSSEGGRRDKTDYLIVGNLTIALTPGNYIEAQNWLKITRRFE
ncbi:hypothetical protein AMTRI_Chr03g47440 [Amborella trichopoda]